MLRVFAWQAKKLQTNEIHLIAIFAPFALPVEKTQIFM
jgi:hypothetical protein